MPSLLLPSVLVAWAATVLTHAVVLADVYMHNPRGSNDRGCEKNQNRENGNRLFDSQNNDKGGYACPFAFPFACYKLAAQVDRDACNEWNADKDYDDISNLGLMDNEGVLDPRATRTPRMYYYEGSTLQIEWTAQHGCGDGHPKTHCDFIIQYACEDTLTDDCGQENSGLRCGPRDGRPLTNTNKNRGQATYQNELGGGTTELDRNDRDSKATKTIPVSFSHNVQSDPRFGRHEGLSYYFRCARRRRNGGLWIADQKNVGPDARSTRQNPDGTRRGLECPEERDYYPYWHPSPWKDIVILTDQFQNCPWIVSQSQNIQPKYECSCPSCAGLVPDSQGGCSAEGGNWVMTPAFDIPAPMCGPPSLMRENNLGNPIGGGKSAASFNWTIPYYVFGGQTCVLRLRYNITTDDPIPNTGKPVSIFGTSAQNAGNSPLKDRTDREIAAYGSFVEYPPELFPAAKLGTAVNTDQTGRTFQDRSWSFEIRPPISGGGCANRAVYNLNVRGKRGNIVDTYPAVEYDFVPNEMYITDQDCVHVQWTGSDYNPDQEGIGGPPDPVDKNADRTDRHNMVQMQDMSFQKPVTSLGAYNMWDIDNNKKMYLMWLGQPIKDIQACYSVQNLTQLIPGGTDRDRSYKDCAKLSGAVMPYFDGGVLRPSGVGDFPYMCTRNNVFGSRAQIGIIHVQSSILTNGNIVFLLLGTSVLTGFAAAGLIAFKRRNHRKRELDGALAAAETAPMVPRRGGGSGGGGAMVAAPIPAMATPPSGPVVVIALYAHSASEAGELEFRKGDKITVLRKDDSGWWEGRTSDGKKGVLPSNYVTAA